jgi:hypothetical protein
MSDEETVSYLVPCLIMIAVLLIPILSYGLIVLRRRYLKEKTRKRLIALLGVTVGLLVVLFSVSGVFITSYIEEYDTFMRYSVEISSDTSSGDPIAQGVIYVPISTNDNLMKATRIEEGVGSYSIVDTDHGKALRVEFRGNVTIRGYHSYYWDEGEWHMSMRNGTDQIWLGYEAEDQDAKRPILSWKLGVNQYRNTEYFYSNYTRVREGWDLYTMGMVKHDGWG